VNFLIKAGMSEF